MPANGSARSVYSTASHLLSPRSLDSETLSSPLPRRSQSVLLPRPRDALSSNRTSSSPYPSSLGLNDPPVRHVTLSRGPGTKDCGVSPATIPPNPRSSDTASATIPSELSRSSTFSYLSTSTSPSAPEFRGRSEPQTLGRPSSGGREFPSMSPSMFSRGSRRPRSCSGWANLDDATGKLSGSNRGLDVLNEIIMAIDVDNDGKVGCAYYTAMDEALVLEEDLPMGGIEAVDTLLLHVQPTSVIIPNRAPGELIELLERDAHRFDDGERPGCEQGSYILRSVVSAQFDYDAGRESLARIDLEPAKPDPLKVVSFLEEPAQSICSSTHHKLMRLAKSINLESCLSIGCAGAVLSDLDRRRVAEGPPVIEDGTVDFRVRSISMNTSADTLLMNADSLLSLQILQSELHPNPQTRSSNSSEPQAREALSISGLLQALASSAQGKRRLRQMLLRPSTDFNVVQERHMTIEVFLRRENGEVVKTMRRQLRKLKNTKTLLLHVRKGVDRIRGHLSIRTADWKALLRFAMVSAQLKQATQALKGATGVPIFSRIRDEIDVKRFVHIGDLIIRTINFQLSKESGHTEILAGASDYLDGLRREFADILDMLPELKESVQRGIPRHAAEQIRHCTVMPQLGFLVAVTLDPETGEGVYHGQQHPEEEWTMCFANDDVVYYKSQLMLDLDSQYGDLPSRILDEEIEVIMGLAAAVLEHEEAILCASELFGELDSLLALALAAEKYNWVSPTLTSSNVIDIVGGRHPLQELLVPSYIPNDCTLAGGCGAGGLEEEIAPKADGGKEQRPSMLILTGPNNSGKSVYMKQVALIVYLAHTGSYVPATRATIGVTDRILTRIATRETVVTDESAFLVDLKQAAFSMNFASRRSLLLIDEFGKGTAAESGSALFAAYLSFFVDLGVERPKVLAGTHFHEVFEHGLLGPGVEVAFRHMEVRLDPEAEDPEEQVTFLFRLLQGRSSNSLGVLCAAASDVPSDVVSRANAIVAMLDKNESLAEACCDQSEKDGHRLKEAELMARRFLELQVSGSGGERGGVSRLRDALQFVLASEGPQMPEVSDGF